MSTSYDLLIINGIVVTASDTGAYDIAIKDEKIVLLAPRGGLDGVESKKVIDAEGGWVTVCLEALSPPFVRMLHCMFYPSSPSFHLICVRGWD